MNASSEVQKSSSVWDEVVRQQVKTMRFGIVQIVVHEGRVVQIERTEKVRLDKGEASQAGEKQS